MKKLFLAAAFVAAAATFVGFAGSASGSPSAAPTAKAAGNAAAPAQQGPFAAPTYCNPCLYYSGDFNAADPNANALANEKDVVVSTGAEVWTPVKPDADWTVSSLFENTLTNNTLDPTSTPWAIRTGMSAGNGGAVYASGSATGTLTPTGRTGFGYTEYTLQVPVNVVLHQGVTYWINIQPQCTNGANPNCAGRAFESNVPPATATNHTGPANILDNSFFNSVFFGANYANANDYGVYHLFSFGVQGTDGTLTVTKQLVSNSLDPGRWDLQIDGTDYATCVGNGGTTGPVPVAAGYHSVGENPCFSGGNYSTTITCSDGSTAYNTMTLDDVYVAPGGSTTCTIRNQRKLFKVG